MPDPSFDTWTIIFLFAAFQGIFLSVILLFDRRGDKLANKLLGFLILSFSIMLLYYVAYWTRYIEHLIIFEGFTWSMPLLFGPLAYLYLKKVKQEKLHPLNILHFLPFMIEFLYVSPFTFSSVEEKRAIMENIRVGIVFEEYMFISIIADNISLLVYSSLILLAKKTYTRNYNQQINNISKRIKWFTRTSWFFVGFSLSYVSYYLVLFSTGYYRDFDYLISFSMSAFIYLVGYTGYKQPEIFWDIKSASKEKAKYSKSSLSEVEANQYLEKIQYLMEKENIYLNSDLRIFDVAQKLDTSTTYVSQIINQKLGKSFNDFVNTYRIREAKRLLRDPNYSHVKILAIAFDSGFNNKASFNAAFRKFVGMAPSEFKKSTPVLVNN